MAVAGEHSRLARETGWHPFIQPPPDPGSQCRLSCSALILGRVVGVPHVLNSGRCGFPYLDDISITNIDGPRIMIAVIATALRQKLVMLSQTDQELFRAVALLKPFPAVLDAKCFEEQPNSNAACLQWLAMSLLEALESTPSSDWMRHIAALLDYSNLMFFVELLRRCPIMTGHDSTAKEDLELLLSKISPSASILQTEFRGPKDAEAITMNRIFDFYETNLQPFHGLSFDRNRTMFLTDNGSIGTSFLGLHEGDFIALMDETCVPVVLRPHQDHHELLHYCFVPTRFAPAACQCQTLDLMVQ